MTVGKVVNFEGQKCNYPYKYLRFYRSLSKGNYSDSSKCYSLREYSIIYQYELHMYQQPRDAISSLPNSQGYIGTLQFLVSLDDKIELTDDTDIYK